jgi:NDP-sugar pyrophosphorylase family protein
LSSESGGQSQGKREFPPVLILAGGLATRLGAIAEKTPKAMVEVAGRPFIAHQLQLLQEQGVREIVLCLSHLSQQIEDFVDDGFRFGLRVQYAYDGDMRLGTGGAVARACTLVDGDFAVLYGDTFLDVPFAPIYQAFLDSNRLGLMTVLKNMNRWDKSNVLLADGQVVEYDKQSDRIDMLHIDYGLSILKRQALESFAVGRSFDLSEVFKDLIAGGQMAGYEVTQRFYEIGTADAIAETDAYLRQRIARKSANEVG